MKWYFGGAVTLCTGVTLYALVDNQPAWCALWAALAIINTISYQLRESNE